MLKSKQARCRKELAAKSIAKDIANEVQQFVVNYTTVAVERTLCRLLGIDGIDLDGVPLPNVLVDSLKERGSGTRCYLLHWECHG